MANRTFQSQSKHDTIVATRERSWQMDSRCQRTWTNPGNAHNASYALNGLPYYPDLIIGLWVAGEIRHGIEEVETGDSVNAEEAVQWRTYARLPQPAWFNLLVPRDHVGEARRLAAGLRLAVIGYFQDVSGVRFENPVRPL